MWLSERTDRKCERKEKGHKIKTITEPKNTTEKKWNKREKEREREREREIETRSQQAHANQERDGPQIYDQRFDSHDLYDKKRFDFPCFVWLERIFLHIIYMYLCGVWNKSSTTPAIFPTALQLLRTLYALNVTLLFGYGKADTHTHTDTSEDPVSMARRMWLLSILVVDEDHWRSYHSAQTNMTRMKMMNIVKMKITIAAPVWYYGFGDYKW